MSLSNSYKYVLFLIDHKGNFLIFHFFHHRKN
nr:MAG TPA: hypothetical protein [Caudoviricetes sp.]